MTVPIISNKKLLTNEHPYAWKADGKIEYGWGHCYFRRNTSQTQIIDILGSDVINHLDRCPSIFT